MLYRDPSAPRLAPLLLALLLGLGSATVPARSLDLGNFARGVPGALASRLKAFFGLWAEDATTPPVQSGGGSQGGSQGGSSTPGGAGVIIDPNGTPRP